MTRALNDQTSTCETCSYWAHDPSADGIHATKLGHCQYVSVPEWVRKHINNSPDFTKMRAHEGLTCWQHTKRKR